MREDEDEDEMGIRMRSALMMLMSKVVPLGSFAVPKYSPS